MFDLTGELALVTGASRGIGRGVASALAAAGAGVVVASRTLADVELVAAEIRDAGGEAQAMALDVSEAEQVQGQLGQFVKETPITIVVNNAGITRDGLFMRMKESDWRSVLETNLDGAYRVTRAVISSMVRQRHGRVINISSVVGQMGNPGQANYVASKAGLIGLTKALAREVASRGITVNAITPGYIETDMTSQMSEKARDAMLAMVPLRRIGSVEDIAAATVFLSSKEAGYITGHVLSINGGIYM